MPSLRQKIASAETAVATAWQDIQAAQALPFYGRRKAERIAEATARWMRLRAERDRLVGCLERAVRRAA